MRADMRRRLHPDDRRADITDRAAQLFLDRGLASVEMEDIRLACGLSRGGLYHHFASKAAVLDGIVLAEVSALADLLESAENPVAVLLESGSALLGREPGIVVALGDEDDRRAYLSSLELAFSAALAPCLAKALAGKVAPEIDPAHVAELFLTVSLHIDRRVLLGSWTEAGAAAFAGTALAALAPLLADGEPVARLAAAFDARAAEP
jgi:AcrR family transcriptional regulator